MSSGSRTAMDARAPATPDRVLRWDGCVNVRDLGGLPLADGGETAYRVVVRADALPWLTEAGRHALVSYGVSLVVNLRPQREDDENPTDALPVRVVRLAMDPRPVAAAWDWPTMREAYLGLADHYRAELAQALTLLGDADPPAAIHCAGGRDRTGIACGMALWLPGPRARASPAGHALSDESWGPPNQEWLAPASDELDREPRLRVVQPAGRTLIDVLEEIDAREGIRNLLLGAGADEASLDRLVAQLRGEA